MESFIVVIIIITTTNIPIIMRRAWEFENAGLDVLHVGLTVKRLRFCLFSNLGCRVLVASPRQIWG